MTDMHDIVGCGFGPSNLALEIAIRESPNSRHMRRLFLELQPMFGWHRQMLLEGTTMQVSFLKDLATMRDPASSFTFLAYLNARGRLSDFINSQIIHPLRIEFHDYLEWAAARVSDSVRYGAAVQRVVPIVRDDVVDALDVTFQVSGQQLVDTVRTRSLVIGSGLKPSVPDGMVLSDRVQHTENFLDAIQNIAASGEPVRIAVLGGGQSAAEAISYLYSTFATTEIVSIISRFGYGAADDSPFVNRIFDPHSVDLFFDAPHNIKSRLLTEHRNTNYAVVDSDLSRQLYLRSYEERVHGCSRLQILNMSAVRGLVTDTHGVTLTVENLATRTVGDITVDGVVLATGYEPADPLDLLSDLEMLLVLDDLGRPVLRRDHRIETTVGLRCPIYLHGAAVQPTHGLSSGLLSTTAVRAGEIHASVLAALTRRDAIALGHHTVKQNAPARAGA